MEQHESETRGARTGTQGSQPDPRPKAGYQSPNRVRSGASAPRPAAGTRPGPGIVIRSPSDLALIDELEKVVELAVRPGQGTAQLAEARERIAFLEGALEASGKLEISAQHFADKLEERSTRAREDYLRELGALRGLLDQRERELRTLALEMGKLQGRLETAEQRLLEARSEGQAAVDRARSDARTQVDAVARASATPQGEQPKTYDREIRLLLLLLSAAIPTALLIWAFKNG